MAKKIIGLASFRLKTPEEVLLADLQKTSKAFSGTRGNASQLLQEHLSSLQRYVTRSSFGTPEAQGIEDLCKHLQDNLLDKTVQDGLKNYEKTMALGCLVQMLFVRGFPKTYLIPALAAYLGNSYGEVTLRKANEQFRERYGITNTEANLKDEWIPRPFLRKLLKTGKKFKSPGFNNGHKIFHEVLTLVNEPSEADKAYKFLIKKYSAP